MAMLFYFLQLGAGAQGRPLAYVITGHGLRARAAESSCTGCALHNSG